MVLRVLSATSEQRIKQKKVFWVSLDSHLSFVNSEAMNSVDEDGNTTDDSRWGTAPGPKQRSLIEMDVLEFSCQALVRICLLYLLVRGRIQSSFFLFAKQLRKLTCRYCGHRGNKCDIDSKGVLNNVKMILLWRLVSCLKVKIKDG